MAEICLQIETKQYRVTGAGSIFKAENKVLKINEGWKLESAQEERDGSYTVIIQRTVIAS